MKPLFFISGVLFDHSITDVYFHQLFRTLYSESKIWGLSYYSKAATLNACLMVLWVTAKIAFVSVFFACILGVIFGVIMTSKNPIIKAICRFYLEFVRIIPLLVLLFLAYFGLAKWFDIHLDGISVCILVFIFWGTAEMGDLVRGALTSIEKHQVESAYALGLTPFKPLCTFYFRKV